MSSDLPVSLRQLVAERAGYRCEYCLLPQVVSLHRHEPDHIVPRQHEGETHEGNLAFACLRCNRYKGPNVGSFDPLTGALVPLFNPRRQRWEDHFRWDGATIQALSSEGRVTVKLLRLNDTDRVSERQRLMAVGLFI
jgi:5-methylcytosine-specific restriction endonuclease McrA